MTNIFKELDDTDSEYDCDTDCDDMDDHDGRTPKKLVSVKASAFLTSDGRNFTTPSAPWGLPFDPQCYYMMTWEVYHKFVEDIPDLANRVIIVGGKNDWAEGCYHVHSMADFNRFHSSLLVNSRVHIIVTCMDMLKGIRDAVGFYVSEIEQVFVQGGPRGDPTDDMDRSLKDQEFYRAGINLWDTNIPPPIPLTRSVAIHPM